MHIFVRPWLGAVAPGTFLPVQQDPELTLTPHHHLSCSAGKSVVRSSRYVRCAVAAQDAQDGMRGGLRTRAILRSAG